MQPQTSRTQKLLSWLSAPPRECTLLFVVGIAAWLLLRSMTKWTVDSSWVYMPHLLADLYLLGMMVCLLPKRGRTVALVIIYIIMYVSGFAESFIYQRYFMNFTPQTLTMINETTPAESAGFVRLCLDSPVFWSTMLWWALLLASHVLILTGRWFVNKHWPQIRQPLQRWAVRIAAPLTLLSLVWWLPARGEMLRFMLMERTEQAERVSNGIFYSTPWRVVYALKFDQLSHREVSRLADNMQTLDALPTDTGVPLIVFIIGESHNKHHSALYGYTLPTTPWQSQMQQDGLLFAMQDAVTPWNVTSSVFKEMMSTHSSDQPGQWTEGVLFPALMRKAGYRVSFITNQFYKTNRQTSVNYNGSFFLNSQPFDSLCFDYRNQKHYLYDLGMLKELPLSPCMRGSPCTPQFIILHLLGQHQPYSERLTKRAHVFSYKDIYRRDLTQDERSIVADYDNATLENDRILQSVYERYKDSEAAFVYLADHGEEVYDGNIGMFGRNHSAEPTPQILWAEFEVPLEVVITPALQQSRPWLPSVLREAEAKPFGIDDICHLLLRLGGVQTKYYNRERDLLSPHFKPRPRPVKGGVGTYEAIMKKNG